MYPWWVGSLNVGVKENIKFLFPEDEALRSSKNKHKAHVKLHKPEMLNLNNDVSVDGSIGGSMYEGVLKDGGRTRVVSSFPSSLLLLFDSVCVCM